MIQHDYMDAGNLPRRLRALFRGYLAFWQSFVWCFIRDAFARDANQFNARAAAAFIIAVGTSAAFETLLMHASLTTRRYVLMHASYVGFSALTDTATLRFGMPLAMLPALFYAARSVARFTPAAALRTIALGTLLTIISTGWVAPSLQRWRALRQRDAFTSATGGRYYQTPLERDLDHYPDTKTWPDLIRGALAPPRHHFPGYPTYIAAEDRGLDKWHRFVIYDRVLLAGLATAAGLLGWMMAKRRDATRGDRIASFDRNAGY